MINNNNLHNKIKNFQNVLIKDKNIFTQVIQYFFNFIIIKKVFLYSLHLYRILTIINCYYNCNVYLKNPNMWSLMYVYRKYAICISGNLFLRIYNLKDSYKILDLFCFILLPSRDPESYNYIFTKLILMDQHIICFV